MSHAKLHRVFIITAEEDPQVPCRILGLFTQRAQLPQLFSVQKTCGEALRIVVELAPGGGPGADRLPDRLRNIPTVLDVAQAWLPPREP